MGVVVRPADQPGDLGWMVWQHGEVYAEQFGWDASFEAMVAGVVGDYAQARDERAQGWIAEADGRRIGCIMCVPLPEDPRIAQLRILLVTPTAAASAPVRHWSTSASPSPGPRATTA